MINLRSKITIFPYTNHFKHLLKINISSSTFSDRNMWLVLFFFPVPFTNCTIWGPEQNYWKSSKLWSDFFFRKPYCVIYIGKRLTKGQKSLDQEFLQRSKSCVESRWVQYMLMKKQVTFRLCENAKILIVFSKILDFENGWFSELVRLFPLG